MDRTQLCGSCDAGSIPAEVTQESASSSTRQGSLQTLKQKELTDFLLTLFVSFSYVISEL